MFGEDFIFLCRRAHEVILLLRLKKKKKKREKMLQTIFCRYTCFKCLNIHLRL